MNATRSPFWRRLALLGACLSTACAHCGEGTNSQPSAGVSAAELRGATTAVAEAATGAPSPCPPQTRLTARGTCVPQAWHCSPTYYAAKDGCDCDCGAVDPDCAEPGVQSFCYNAGNPAPVASCAACVNARPATEAVRPE